MGETHRAGGETVPAVPLCLTVGVTGHRDVAAIADHVSAGLTRMLAELRDAVLPLHATGSFAAAPPRFTLVCPLAQGADQLAAAIALDLGYELHAVLPFGRAAYAGDFVEPGGAERFADLLARAARVLELSCIRGEDVRAYGLAGRATVAHCDVLIAVWDGLPARGPGGTAEVVEFALRSGVPVIHLSTDPARPPQLVWSLHDPHLPPTRVDETATRAFEVVGAASMIDAVLGPPRDPVERARLDQFCHERARRLKFRVEYPLLLALTGTQPLRRSALLATRADPVPAEGHLATWAAAFAGSDALAAHFAQNYRSGHVFNFIAAAVAVLLGLSGLLVPTVKVWLAFAELAVIGAFVLNTRVAVARDWHRRWLDYRQLAERLRPMASLVALGIARPERRPVTRGGQRWVDWYAAGIWRSIGLPEGQLPEITDLTAATIASELDPQVAYHRRTAGIVHRLDHRLHRAGTILFLLSCLSCIVFIALYFIDHDWIVHHAAAFVALSAGLPAIGTAFFGIRVQGDFAGTAARSEVTADHLAAIAAALRDGPASLSRTADGVEAAARAMVADLGEWRLSHQQRQLELG